MLLNEKSCSGHGVKGTHMIIFAHWEFGVAIISCNHIRQEEVANQGEGDGLIDQTSCGLIVSTTHAQWHFVGVLYS